MPDDEHPFADGRTFSQMTDDEKNAIPHRGRAFAALAEHAEATARDRGARQLLGPVSLLPNQTGGVITSGWGERGFVDSPWNLAWHPDVWEAQGFTRCFTGATWICERLPDVDPHLFDRGAIKDPVQIH